MNNDLFNQARELYQARNYQEALDAYTQCLQDARCPLQSGETGLLYHQIGNCLVKLKNPNEAILAYTQATADSAYDACGSLNYNLGAAYASLHDFENAVRHFEISVSDARYATPYKAYIGMGNALMKLGKSAEAGVAFREAALDGANPDPSKALLNLGVCFMALNRPADAVSSYESALPFDMDDQTRNKLCANLGQAYVATGQMQKAVNFFEEALEDKTYTLSDSASVDYQSAVAAVAQGASELTQQIPVQADMSGLDVTADGQPVYDEQDMYGFDEEPYYFDDEYVQDGYPAGEYAENGHGAQGYGAQGYGSGDERFFTASDEELEQWSRGMVKQDRKRRNVGLKILLVFIILIVLAFGACVFAYTQGYGYPSQSDVVEELFANPSAASSSVISSDVKSDAVDTMLGLLVEDADVSIDGINKSMSDAEVYVTAKTAEGGSLQYKVSLVRDMITWKVTNVELYFPSQN